MALNSLPVYIIDDDEAVRDSLAFFIKSAGLDVKTYSSAERFLDDVHSRSPGCIVTDVKMPELSGIDLLKKLRERGIFWPVIIMTGHGDVPLAVQAMKLGALDFLEKPFDNDALLIAVETAFRRLINVGVKGNDGVELKRRLGTLSGRESDVLRGLISGAGNKQIALDLGISPRTVEVYRANVMSKMQASSLSELIKMAILVDFL